MDELAELIDQFRAEVGYPDGVQARREAERAELATALTEEALSDPDVEPLRRLAAQDTATPACSLGIIPCSNPGKEAGAAGMTLPATVSQHAIAERV